MNNPILAFSGKRRMRSIRTPLLLTLYSLAIAVITFIFVYNSFLSPTLTISQMGASVDKYALIIVLQFGLLILIAPTMTAGCITGERERQTLDLLLVTNTNSFQIVLGKLLESFGFLALLVLCSAPSLSFILLTGGASILQLLLCLLFLLAIALATSCVGLFFSSFLKRTVTSTVLTYITIFAIGIVTLLPLFHDVRRIGEIFDSINIAGKELVPITYVPISFVTNPGLALFSLLSDQTSFFDNYLYEISYTIANTRSLIDYNRFAIYHIIFLFSASIVLILFSSLNVRGLKIAKGKKK